MHQYQNLLKAIIVQNTQEDGVHFDRETRSGDTAAIFGANLSFDLRKGFPIVTTKRVPFKAVAGELLWFLNKGSSLSSLRYRSDIEEGAWTIWTQDCERWNKARGTEASDDLGDVYGVQWRDCNGVDQIANLVERIKKDPMSRYHIVNAWNVEAIDNDEMALPPCHMMFQVFCSHDGYMDLMWTQRSVDAFLGLPFNIASYGMLLTMLAQATGYRPRHLKASLGDVHIYADHFDQVLELLDREPMALPRLKLPKVLDKTNFFQYLDTTAKDWELIDYVSHAAIKAPLLVGGDGVNHVDKVVDKEPESAIITTPKSSIILL